MNYTDQILFFFGAIGAFNSLIVATYLLINKSYKILSNRLFGVFLLILSLRVLKSLFYAFSTEKPIWFLQSGPSFFLLIGPLFFSYILSIIKPNSFFVRYWKQITFFWVSIVVGLIVLVPFADNNELYKKTILPIINGQWLIFLLLSALTILSNLKRKIITPIKMKWVFILFTAVLIIWLSFTFIKFDYFVSGSIIFSTLFYSFFLFFLFKKKITSKIFETIKQKNTSSHLAEADVLIDRLNTIMSNEKLFTNPDLKLLEVAQKLEISSHELSKLLNNNLGKSFTDWVNEYRIEEAKQLLQNNSLYTIEAIGNQSGFNSKSAFYKAFKKLLGTTPAKYKTPY